MAPNVTCALLSFSLLRKKEKKNILPDLIYIFPLFLEQGRGKQPAPCPWWAPNIRVLQTQSVWRPCPF